MTLVNYRSQASMVAASLQLSPVRADRDFEARTKPKSSRS